MVPKIWRAYSKILVNRDKATLFSLDLCSFCNPFVPKVLLLVSKLWSTGAVGTTMSLTTPLKRLVSRITFARWLAHTAATGVMRITMTSIHAAVLNLILVSPIA